MNGASYNKISPKCQRHFKHRFNKENKTNGKNLSILTLLSNHDYLIIEIDK